MRKEDLLGKDLEFWYCSHNEKNWRVLGIWEVKFDRIIMEGLSDGSMNLYKFKAVNEKENDIVYGAREKNIEDCCFLTRIEAYDRLIKSLHEENEEKKESLNAIFKKNLEYYERIYKDERTND